MHSSALLALAASVGSAAAGAIQGFNYGSTNTDQSPVTQQRFQELFTAAKGLVGHSGFTSARLYTMIQGGTTNDPTEAIAAAIDTQTTLLFGMWCSAGQDAFNDEIAALKSAISQYGSKLAGMVEGISVGSEDLYRISPTGIENKSGAGAEPDTLVSYIGQVRDAIQGTPLSGIPIGHVDTWTAWVNGSNDAVISAIDWLGVDAYPYFQTTDANSIQNGNSTFFQAYDNTVGAAGGKEVWITETGWPVSGPTSNLAIPSIANAKAYWDAVACNVLGRINTYWYTLQDSYPTTPSPSFGIVGSQLSTTPLFDLTCPKVQDSGSNGSGQGSSTSATTASNPTTGGASMSTGAASATPSSTGGAAIQTAAIEIALAAAGVAAALL